jgi:hypothetical protein
MNSLADPPKTKPILPRLPELDQPEGHDAASIRPMNQYLKAPPCEANAKLTDL